MVIPPKIKTGQIWTHKNGGEYEILFLANEGTKDSDKYPLTVIYQSCSNGAKWARPAWDWHRSFKFKSDHK